MNHAIEFQSTHYELLTITPRKKSLHNQLFRVESGKVLLKLGKNEYVYNAGDAFWLPFDCLSSLTILPGSHVNSIRLSVRLSDPFPNKAGQVSLTPLMTAVIDRLRVEWAHSEKRDDLHLDLLTVVKHDLLRTHPKLSLSLESQQVSQWTPDSTDLTGELALILRVREARKMKLSGIKSDKICAALFGNNEAQFTQLYHSLLGESI
ncbi:AraC family transcriptional regulator [Vibrio methylphosphonaticus]|uniref:AraC family transcriptional regulator n=1 Tax=Vibrio methylphosphonaticus TaxID=2946866 RepID=UPI00202AB498|nr:AraC family transcriptional regulator [Vibrio methylphosphonaticus]MCL9774132.1 AraC family transcriptional regulator [Vibrio methylphosphonaticus]